MRILTGFQQGEPAREQLYRLGSARLLLGWNISATSSTWTHTLASGPECRGDEATGPDGR